MSLVKRPPSLALLSSSEDTHYQQYGRPPKFVRKHNGPGRKGRFIPSRKKFTRSFEESRRRSECHKCGDHWRPGHRCRPGAIQDYVRERLKSGESSVHIVSDLVSGLEGELEEEVESQIEEEVEQETSNNVGETTVRFTDTPSEVALFDSLTAKKEACDTRVIEAIDKDWFTNRLSASLVQREGSQYPEDSRDF